MMCRQNGAWYLNLSDLTGEEDVELTDTGGWVYLAGGGRCP